MEYTVNKLADLSGVSKRTLRYYDEIDLLKPKRISSNGYRIYGREQVDLLQQILFYRELEIPLGRIKELISDPSFNREEALEHHLEALLQRKHQLERLIKNVKQTIGFAKGEMEMQDKEKFEGFKKDLLEQNENTYGEEIRERYGDETVDASNARLANMSPEQWEQQKELSGRITALLKQAMEEKDPGCESAQKACELHRQWLTMFWKEGSYSKEAHRNLGEMYAGDPRFAEYYEKEIGLGGAGFFRDALGVYCG